MVSGAPYISVNRATMNAEKPPRARQSRVLFGWKKLKAKMIITALSSTTSGQRP